LSQAAEYQSLKAKYKWLIHGSKWLNRAFSTSPHVLRTPDLPEQPTGKKTKAVRRGGKSACTEFSMSSPGELKTRNATGFFPNPPRRLVRECIGKKAALAAGVMEAL